MATLALSRDFVTQFSKLQKPIQAKVSDLAGKFQKMTAQQLRDSKGIHLETYTNQRDQRARTIRIDDNHRGVVLDAGNDETYVLCLVETHDKVDRWMLNNEFRVNEATGALELVDSSAIAEAVTQVEEQAEPTPEESKLFAHRKDKDFTQLGIDADLLPALRAFNHEDQLQGLLMVLPSGQADALMLLTGDETVEAIYAQVAGDIEPEAIDPDDLAAAVETPASKAQFHVVSDEDELQEMLAQPLAQWRTYLHPSQREAAYKDQYNGPARITGGAGTGKTVVAIHRAAHLATEVETGRGKPILFTTFTTNLAEAIERDLRSLAGSDVLDLIEVINVDRLSHRIVSGAESSSPKVVPSRELDELWQDAVDELGLPFSPTFLNAEFEQVILAQGIGSRSDYFTANRAGRGVRLARRDRAKVWKALEQVAQELARNDQRTHLQLAQDAAGYLGSRAIKPYRHVIVDEAQDLHETQWRLLRAAVPEAPNDMFIVGDSHQRIYDRRTSLSSVGIKIVGRSRRLKINYRTTHEILRWAMTFLGEEPYDDLDEGVETQTSATYHSFLHGPEPTMVAANSKHEELQQLVAQVAEWRAGGVQDESIAVAVRTSDTMEAVEAVLSKAGITTTRLGGGLPTSDGVRIATMHRLKGVEFRCVALVDADDENVPLRWAVTSEREDPVQHQADLRRERCTAYVAATRARDDLWVGWSGRPSRFLEPMLA